MPEDIGPLDFGPVDVSPYSCSPVNIYTLPEGPPGHVEKLLNISTKFRRKLSVPDVVVYDSTRKVHIVIEVCTAVLYILLLCTLIHYFSCNIFSQG